MGLNWSKLCCICGREVQSYHNPDPVRDGVQDCCNSCNELVIKAREKLRTFPREKHAEFILRLHSMTYSELMNEFGSKENNTALL